MQTRSAGDATLSTAVNCLKAQGESETKCACSTKQLAQAPLLVFPDTQRQATPDGQAPDSQALHMAKDDAHRANGRRRGDFVLIENQPDTPHLREVEPSERLSVVPRDHDYHRHHQPLGVAAPVGTGAGDSRTGFLHVFRSVQVRGAYVSIRRSRSARLV